MKIFKENNLTSPEEKKLITITGYLTSPIQLRNKDTEPYYYSFIKLKGQSTDLPVIFKISSDPPFNPANIPKHSQVKLQGNYSQSKQNIRKSFTAYSYELITPETKSLTLSELKIQVQSLLKVARQKHQKWHQKKDFLTKKLAQINELEYFTNLDSKYCQAYLLTRDINYTNFQANISPPNFTYEDYLARITREVSLVEK